MDWVEEKAKLFSKQMLSNLKDRRYLIKDAVDFIESDHGKRLLLHLKQSQN